MWAERPEMSQRTCSACLEGTLSASEEAAGLRPAWGHFWHLARNAHCWGCCVTSRPRSSGFTGLCHPALAVPSPGGGKDGSILVKMHQIRAGREKTSVNYGRASGGFHSGIVGYLLRVLCVFVFLIFFSVCMKAFFLMETSLTPLQTHLQL